MYSLQPVSRCCQDVLSLFRYQTGWNLLIYQAEKRNFDFQKSELRFLFQKIYCEEVFYNVNILPTLFQSTAAWPLITSMDKPESFSHSTAYPKHCFRNHDSRACQPMPKHCTVSCSTAWAYLLKMVGWTNKAGCSSSSQSKIRSYQKQHMDEMAAGELAAAKQKLPEDEYQKLLNSLEW